MGRLRLNRQIVARNESFACPLCNSDLRDIEKDGIGKLYERLWKHIAGYLKSLAFLSLPYLEDLESRQGIAAFSESVSDRDDVGLSTCLISNHNDKSEHLYCDRESCDCADGIKDSMLDCSSLEAAFKGAVAIQSDKLPTSHDDPSYSLTEKALEWDFVILSL